MPPSRLLFAATLAAVVVVVEVGAAQRVIPSGTARSGTLSFDGRASVGDFVGVTTTVAGEMTAGAALAEVRGWVETPVNTLKTGNGRRDRDLNKSMESDKYPALRFELVNVHPEWERGDSAAVALEGQLTIHGVTRAMSLGATVLFQPDGIRVVTQFPLNLKDYRIGGLSKFLGVLKMHPDIVVHVDVVFGAGGTQHVFTASPSPSPTSTPPAASARSPASARG